MRPDYYADRPRACMDGWARRYIVVTPDGVVLPCHQATSIAGMAFENVRERAARRHLERFARAAPVPRRRLDAGAVPDLRRAAQSTSAAAAARRSRSPATPLRPTRPARCRPDTSWSLRRARARSSHRPSLCPFGCAGCAPRHEPRRSRSRISPRSMARWRRCAASRSRSGRGRSSVSSGPNGAGKTTTIKILCTLLQPTSGRARLAGLDVVTSPGDVRRRIGVIFQDPALDDRLTAEENLMLHAVAYRVPRGERAARIAEALRFVDLQERGARPDAHVLGGHEAAARDRARPDPPPGHPVSRRADHRARSADARAHLGGVARRCAGTSARRCS